MHSSVLLVAAEGAGLVLDDAQRHAAARLDALLRALAGGRPARGAYLWGPVGRGKTWLLDRFHEEAPVTSRRFHFHDFYRTLHAEVHTHRGDPHAVDAALDALLGECRLLCFDELHLHDVGDTMLLTRTLRALSARGTTLVATSNYPPDGLLPDPLFHHLAGPLIELVKTELDILAVDGPVDYRTLAAATGTDAGFRSGLVLVPGSDEQLAAAGLPRPTSQEAVAVPLHAPVPGRATRTVPALRERDGHVWFDFRTLCSAHVSALDLLTLAERFSSWVVSDVVPLAACTADVGQRFVHLVDVLHDRDVPLMLTASAPLDVVLETDRAPLDLPRTVSRLRLLRTLAEVP